MRCLIGTNQVRLYCQSYAPLKSPISAGAFDDPRFELRVADALVELEASKPGSWDAVSDETAADTRFVKCCCEQIIWDLPDAHAGTVFLYLQPVMQLIKSRLAPDGVFVSHAGGACKW